MKWPDPKDSWGVCDSMGLWQAYKTPLGTMTEDEARASAARKNKARTDRRNCFTTKRKDG